MAGLGAIKSKLKYTNKPIFKKTNNHTNNFMRIFFPFCYFFIVDLATLVVLCLAVLGPVILDHP